MNAEYPAEEELLRITEWKDDYPALMDFIKSIWWMPEWGFSIKEVPPHRMEYHLSTGGWSGNESIISAMRNNTLFWALAWYQFRRGGHYIFVLSV